MSRFLFIFFICLASTVNADPATQTEFFEQHIRPVLIKHCYECHAEDADEVGGGLLLD
ncbi:MAG: hypothetical protein R3C05_20650 [Pirellulaceae bacterium]